MKQGPNGTLTAAKLDKKSHHFMEPEVPLHCYRETTIGSYPEPDESFHLL